MPLPVPQPKTTPIQPPLVSVARPQNRRMVLDLISAGNKSTPAPTV